MKVVLLAGGAGTRISEESEYRPKPMVEIGGMPILWHIMKEYSYFGYNEFIICAGYKQEMIKKWFADYTLRMSDVTFDFTGKQEVILHDKRMEPWKVTVVDTGYSAMTGGRLMRVRDYIGDERFMLTYGDGVCDVDIGKLVKFHEEHGKKATLTSVLFDQTKGVLDISDKSVVTAFREKVRRDSAPINAGYMVFEPGVFDFISGDDSILETEVLASLAEEGELMSYSHSGFWQCMDTLREKIVLEEMIARGAAPWIRW